MAYFPNGSSGEYYQSQFCERCRNYRDEDDGRGFGCPIWDAHMIHNYERADNLAVKSILDILIPMDGIEVKQCSMFRSIEEPKI